MMWCYSHVPMLTMGEPGAVWGTTGLCGCNPGDDRGAVVSKMLHRMNGSHGCITSYSFTPTIYSLRKTLRHPMIWRADEESEAQGNWNSRWKLLDRGDGARPGEGRWSQATLQGTCGPSSTPPRHWYLLSGPQAPPQTILCMKISKVYISTQALSWVSGCISSDC
jgi:hypothetical protein